MDRGWGGLAWDPVRIVGMRVINISIIGGWHVDRALVVVEVVKFFILGRF